MTREEAVNIIKSECYVFNPLNFDRSTRINTALDMAIEALEQEPTRKKRKWLNKDASGYHFYGKCSECGQEFCVDAWYTQNMKFCPNCGAEMEESKP